MAINPFLQSRTLAGYNPQFLDTGPVAVAGAGAATPANPTATGREDLTNRLLQIMSGQLGGTLSGGEKLSALGALLKSVSRGSQTSPQDVVRGIQQQKMAEVQGALQIQELRKAAAEKAKTDALKAEYVSQLSETNPQLARAIALMSPEKFSEFVIEQNKPQGLGQWSENLGRFIPKDRPVPTRSGSINGMRVDEYSDGSKRVYDKSGGYKTYDVEGNLING